MTGVLPKILKWLAALLAIVVLGCALIAWWLYDRQEYDGPVLPGTLETGSLEHNGLTRSWQAYVPTEKSDRPPVLLVLHGSGGDADKMRRGTFYAFDDLAEREGFIPVYVDGFENHWNDCRASAAYSANQQNVDDVGYIRALIRELQDRYSADSGRVYVTGMSNGGHMAYRLALEAPELVAGIAPIAANLPVAENQGCTPAGTAIPTLIINGTDDLINPYRGGVVKVYGDTSRGPVLSSEDTALYWARLSGVGDAGLSRDWPEQRPGDGTTVYSVDWRSAGGEPVTLITVDGGGHTIPHSRYRMPRILGKTSHEFTAADIIWSFFQGRDYLNDRD